MVSGLTFCLVGMVSGLTFFHKPIMVRMTGAGLAGIDLDIALLFEFLGSGEHGAVRHPDPFRDSLGTDPGLTDDVIGTIRFRHPHLGAAVPLHRGGDGVADDEIARRHLRIAGERV
jgi:hypothetical protein